MSREVSVEIVEQVDRVMHPAVLDRAAETATTDDLTLMASQAKGLARVAWTTYCIVCAHLVKRIAENGNKRTRKGMTEAAKITDSHISDISRAVQVYERIIKPRIEQYGEMAVFPVHGRSYYELAADAERHSGRSAMRLIEEVEDRLAEGRFSVREFRQYLIEQGAIPASARFHDATTRSESDTVREVLGALVKCHDDACEYFMRTDTDRASEYILEAHEVLSRWKTKLEKFLESAPVVSASDRDEDVPFDGI